jgi:hypothetical protein
VSALSLNFVRIEGLDVEANYRTRDEAKLALKELKLLKREYGVRKRTINEEQKAIRASYTDEVRSRGSMMRGRGTFANIFRTVQTVHRDSRRAELAQALAPLEAKKQKIENLIRSIDSVILQVEVDLI